MFEVARPYITPAQYAVIKRDFVKVVFDKYLNGNLGAKKVFFNAKRLLFNALVDFMNQKLDGAFWLVSSVV